jgi:hypothetical protein
MARSIATRKFQFPSVQAPNLKIQNPVMTTTKLKIGILTSLVVIGLAALLARQQQSQNELREKNRALQGQIDQFTQLAADNQTNSLRAAQPISDAQMYELLRLRNEVGQLREQSAELANLRAALATAQKVESTKPQVASTQSEPIPKDAWTNAGYATPEAAFQTICFAMSKGDLQTYLNSLSPEQQTNMLKSFQNKSEAEIAAGQMAEMEPVSDFQVLGKIEVGPDQVQMLVHTAGEDLNTIFIMTNVNNSWKFGNMVKEN